MSDPFDALRGGTHAGSPDVAAIKSRARGIERRRRVVLSSSAAVIAAIAIAGVLVKTVPGPSQNELAQSHATPTAATTQSEFNAAAPPLPSAAAGAAGQTKRIAAATPTAPAGAERVTSGAAMGAAPAADSRSDQLDVTLAVAPGPHNAKLTLKACNPHDTTVQRTFNTSQQFDFEVRRNGSLVWRWSDGMMFAQHVSQDGWAPKACKTWTATWDGTNSSRTPAASGSYQAVGILTSSPRQSSAPATFCLVVCG